MRELSERCTLQMSPCCLDASRSVPKENQSGASGGPRTPHRRVRKHARNARPKCTETPSARIISESTGGPRAERTNAQGANGTSLPGMPSEAMAAGSGGAIGIGFLAARMSYTVDVYGNGHKKSAEGGLGRGSGRGVD